jgi:hypothetical protein
MDLYWELRFLGDCLADVSRTSPYMKGLDKLFKSFWLFSGRDKFFTPLGSLK